MVVTGGGTGIGRAVVDRFVEKSAENGMDVFRVFDALNDIRNLRRAMQAVRRTGKHAEGTICYTTSPLHSVDDFVELAEQLVELGADSICVKDMAALLKPQPAYDLVRAHFDVLGRTVAQHGGAVVNQRRGIQAEIECRAGELKVDSLIGLADGDRGPGIEELAQGRGVTDGRGFLECTAQRLEAAVAVARDVHAHRTFAGDHCLGAAAVAVVAAIGIRLAQVMPQLGTDHTLNQRLLERQRGGVDLLAGHRTGHKLVHQLLGNLGKGRATRSNLRVLLLRLAQWHKCSCWSCYASHTKFRTGSSVPAISCKQWLTDWNAYPFPEANERSKPPEELIIFSMPARLLRKLSGVYVRKREGTVASGIQRVHEKERSDKISQYVRAGYPFGDLSSKQKADPANDSLKKPGWLPTAIVVNILKEGDDRRGKVVDKADLVDVVKNADSLIKVVLPENVNDQEWAPKGFSPIEVIDGQHRLFAFHEDSGLPEDFELPVVAFHGLDIGWQAYLFWSINVSPKKINPSHAYDLFPLLRTQDWLEVTPSAHIYREARAQELTDLLYRHPSSPWHGRINMLGERRSGWVSQAGWVQSIFNSFFSLGTTARSRKGLFASNLNQTSGPLEWSRPQQAAFLMYLWRALKDAIRAKTDGWVVSLREVDGQQIDFADNHDLAFAGPKTLLNQEQGVRGFSLAVNDLLCAKAIDLKLHEWTCDEVDGGETRDEDIDMCLDSLSNAGFALSIAEAVKALAEFDWRSYDAPGLTSDEALMKAGFRGTGGYSRIRQSLLEIVAKQATPLGHTAAALLQADRE